MDDFFLAPTFACDCLAVMCASDELKCSNATLCSTVLRRTQALSCSMMRVWVQSSVISNVHARVIVICSVLTHSWIPLSVRGLSQYFGSSSLLFCVSVDRALTESGNCSDVWNVRYSSAHYTIESHGGTGTSIRQNSLLSSLTSILSRFRGDEYTR